MSVQHRMWDDGPDRADYSAGSATKSAALWREVAYLLTINTKPGRRGSVTPSGLAHAMGVCLIEGWNVARGRGTGKGKVSTGAMPRFVDIRLTAEERSEFPASIMDAAGCVEFLRRVTDRGYRVGCSWSGETSSFTVSLTGREPGSVNEGLCMTSFAGDLLTAISLACYKHEVLSEGDWQSRLPDVAGDFG